MKRILFLLLLTSNLAFGQDTITVTVPGNGAGSGSGSGLSGVSRDFRLSNDSLYLRNSVNIEDFGAVGDGTTNNATAIAAAIASGAKVIYVPAGTFLITGSNGATPLLTLQDYQVLMGSGYNSVLKTTTNARMIGLAVRNEIFGIRFTGSYSKASTGEFQTALYGGSNDLGISIHDNWFEFFGGNSNANGGAVVFSSTTNGAQIGSRIENNDFYNNHYAVTMASRGEYNIVIGNKIWGSKIGIYNEAGNTATIGNTIQDCDTAYKLYGGTNNGHCISSGNTYNHNVVNLVVDAITNGHSFVGDMFYAGNIAIRNSTGIRFNDCDFSLGTITLTNNTSLYRSGRWLTMTKTVASGEDFNVLGEQKTGTTAGYWIKQANTDTVDFAGPMYGTIPSGVGTKAVRYNPSTRQYTYADTTTGIGSGATPQLDNLSSVAINTSLISDADNTDDLGSSAKAWKDAYLYTLKLKGSSSGTATITPLSAAGSTTIYLPASTGHIMNFFAANESGGVSAPAPWGGARQNLYVLSGLSTNATFAAPSGTALDGNVIYMRIQDNGTSRTLSWNAIYDEGADLSLPTATIAGEGMRLQFSYNDTSGKWELIGKTGGF